MKSNLTAQGSSTSPSAWHLLPLMVALSCLIVPSLWRMAQQVWPLDEQAHGPIIILVVVFLVWQQRDLFQTIAPDQNHFKWLGWVLLVAAMLIYYLGRIHDIIFFEACALIISLASLTLIFFARQGVTRLWFPIVFLVFMLPLPGFIVDQATSSLKLIVSRAAAAVIHLVGLPVARDGVLLQIGQYKLLVADACSGLYSLISLSALGILYLWLIRSNNVTRNIILFAAIFPIAVTANIFRVVLLCLVTYYMGDEAGQGFLHGFAGLSLFLAALGLIIGLDTIFRKLMPDRTSNAGKATV
jgi:exosortase B